MGDVSDSAENPPVPTTGFTAAGVLLVVAFAGAASAGVLGTVGPYLLGVSALVASLFGVSSLVVFGRR